MEYAVLSYKNKRYLLRGEKSNPPSSQFYKCSEYDPSNVVGLYRTYAEASSEFDKEASKKGRKWIHLIVIESRQVIKSQVIYEIDINCVGRL